MSRLEDNMKILATLKKYLKDNPDQRFGQALRNIGIIVDYSYEGETCWTNHFDEEPQHMLNRMGWEKYEPQG